MKNLNALPTPPAHIVHLITIREAMKIPAEERGSERDRKLALTAAHDLIQTRYTMLENAVSTRQLERLEESIAMRRLSSALRSCYDNDASGIRSLKTLIEGAQSIRFLKYCPMCATTMVATYDHYLPASLFPEYSVHPLNLVPCCSRCNSMKGSDWLDASGKRQYLHLYSDVIPNDSFLRVELRTATAASGVGAVFSLLQPPQISAGSWLVIKSHFSRLGLLDRYADQSNDEIAEALADCRIFLEEGGRNVNSFLAKRAEERANIYGPNHWIAILFAELANSSMLVNWVGQVRSQAVVTP